jgi:5'-nucleotidase
MAGRDCALVEFGPSRPLIVLTNDDGVESPGLTALKTALDPLGEVRIVAPDQNRSGAARSITMHSPLWVEEVELPDGSLAFSTDGTPVDCVRMAALGLLDRTPDLIVSGINLGGNLGDDITYSGTVAAALEGIMLDIPAVALSAEGYHPGYDLSVPARFAHRLISVMLAKGFPAKTLLNVNCPDRSWDTLRGARMTILGKRIYGDKVQHDETRGSRRRYYIYNDDLSYHHEKGTDFEAIAEGWVSITPLHFDLMSHEALDRLRGWEQDLGPWMQNL